MTLEVRKTTLAILSLSVLCCLVAFGLNGYKLTVSKIDPFQPPPGYRLVNKIDLSRQGHTQSVVHTITLDKPTAVGIYLLIENINSDYLDVRLTGPAHYDHVLIHAEGYTALKDNPRLEESLPPGHYDCILTSKLSPGTLSIYIQGALESFACLYD